ncbi:unnamed protein product [marine sediment metagenome]|uniref:Uncharacterized protein n=1 Tax=marine sediment metagenome TaxID=412755 RepID=X1S1B5_9ZZZZ
MTCCPGQDAAPEPVALNIGMKQECNSNVTEIRYILRVRWARNEILRSEGYAKYKTLA